MSDYLESLVARSLGRAQTIQPRLASLFEPVPIAHSPAVVEIGDSTRTQPTVLEEISPAAEIAPELHAPAPVSNPISQPPQTPAIEGMAAQPADPVAAAPKPHAAPVSSGAPQQPIASRLKSEIERPIAAGPQTQPTPARVLSESVQPSMAHVETGRAASGVDLPQSKNPTSAAIEPRAQVLTRAGVEHVLRPAANLRAEAATAPTTIRITIGRVDVRALMPESPRVHRKPAAPRPALSLDEYLKRR